jgi:Nif-specific regulatory protein
MTETRTVLLRASAILYLFRAIASADDPDQRSAIERQLIHVISELIPSNGGIVLLGRNPDDFAALARERDLASLASRITSGAVHEHGTLAVPLCVRGVVCGLLALNGSHGDDAADTLAAIATIASSAIENAREIESLHEQKAILEEHSGGIVGQSASIRRIIQMAERVAPRDTTVLILGESGTGKELIARVVHDKSARAKAPFVAINCAAITDTLLESELFGHEKGAFTGAVALKKGKLEIAEGGTVFLDEVGELAAPLQAKLLRVLQQREFERVGGTRTLRLDVRLVAATNRDLAAEVRAGRFREDLYHRLNVVALRTPPLRERRDDIPALAEYFAARSAAGCGRRVTAISPEAMRALSDYDWPGNVRELENAIERAVVLGDSPVILLEDLPETVLEGEELNVAAGFQSAVGDAKRDAIVRAWTEARGDYKAAAFSLGLHPNSLLRLVRKLGIRATLDKL